jgi:hypothetical protein
MVEQDELELKPSRLRDFRRVGDDFHALFCRSETGLQESGLSPLLDHTEAASAEGNEPAIMAESGNTNSDRLGSIEDRLSLLDLYSNVIDL